MVSSSIRYISLVEMAVFNLPCWQSNARMEGGCVALEFMIAWFSYFGKKTFDLRRSGGLVVAATISSLPQSGSLTTISGLISVVGLTRYCCWSGLWSCSS
jgi:hypothetical protein